ncbi:mobilization protein [Roseobacter sp. A03A-229]
MAETELERAEKRYAQAKARLQALRNREATKQRKLDTRRKVILGGALLDFAERDSGAAAMVDRLVRNLSRDQDRMTCSERVSSASSNFFTELRKRFSHNSIGESNTL